jgi:predicted O-methyltransferase YrrM
VIDHLEQDLERLKDHWCLPREDARLLYLLARSCGCRRILEIGTSIGYSTLHLAQAMQETNGQVVSIDASGERQAEARRHLEAAGLAERVTLLTGDALTVLAQLQQAGERFDLMFLDARKSEYKAYWQVAETLLTPEGLLLADNTRSHRQAMRDFIEAVENAPDWVASDLETPNGLLVAGRSRGKKLEKMPSLQYDEPSGI